MACFLGCLTGFRLSLERLEACIEVDSEYLGLLGFEMLINTGRLLDNQQALFVKAFCLVSNWL